MFQIAGPTGDTLNAHLKRVTRAELYGRKERVAVDAMGEPCERAAVTADGKTLIRPGMAIQGYIDPEGDSVSTKALQTVDAEGNTVEKIESSLSVTHSLTEIEPDRLLDLERLTTYHLELTPESEEHGSETLAALISGALFHTRFSHRGGHELDDAILVMNKAGDLFLHVGTLCEPTWFGPDTIAAEDPADGWEVDVV